MTSNVAAAIAFVKITPDSAVKQIPNEPNTSPNRRPSADDSPPRLSTADGPDTTASRTSASRSQNALTWLDPPDLPTGRHRHHWHQTLSAARFWHAAYSVA
jgi:hypothetical protein